MIIDFKQTDQSLIHLINSDIILGKLIHTIGEYSLNLNANYYLSLTQSIIGQQLSIKAKQTIWNRVLLLCNNKVTPENILSLTDKSLRDVGVSFRKISYIKGLSKKVSNETITFNDIEKKSNEDVLKLLTSINGIGNWTAEMFLIFSLGRLDVFAFDDIGLQRSIKWLYKLDEDLSHSTLEQISNKWAPYRSIASLYLWEIVNRTLIKTINPYF